MSTAALREITAASAGADSAARAAQAASDPDLAYGPDDPGYGPPGPDWYLRDQEDPVVAEAATTHVVADVAPAAAVPIRSPFEPLPRTSTGSRPTEAGPTEAGETGAGEASDSRAAEHADYELPSYPSVGYEGPGAADFDLIESGDESGDGAFGQLRNLYASAERLGAETVGDEDADGQFGQLLERQRKLISEYFKESGALSDTTANISDITDMWSAR